MKAGAQSYLWSSTPREQCLIHNRHWIYMAWIKLTPLSIFLIYFFLCQFIGFFPIIHFKLALPTCPLAVSSVPFASFCHSLWEDSTSFSNLMSETAVRTQTGKISNSGLQVEFPGVKTPPYHLTKDVIVSWVFGRHPTSIPSVATVLFDSFPSSCSVPCCPVPRFLPLSLIWSPLWPKPSLCLVLTLFSYLPSPSFIYHLAYFVQSTVVY